MKNIMALLSVFALVSIVSTGPAQAQDKTADQLIASKKKADMTYRQLMEIMGRASTMIHEGIIRENKQMVKTGTQVILNHPAPNHKPWSIMAKADQADFKATLPSFNKMMDANAARIETEAGKGNWEEATTASHELMSVCMSCHSVWRARVQ